MEASVIEWAGVAGGTDGGRHYTPRAVFRPAACCNNGVVLRPDESVSQTARAMNGAFGATRHTAVVISNLNKQLDDIR